ncbi:MAG: NAD-glutamate dehydrogenase [Coxiellaceae bacterium]|nr:NAD-glutamate dehydrogenase [Coxiellaceae bacterium]
MSKHNTEVGSIIEQVVDFAKSHPIDGINDAFFDFIHIFLRNLSIEDLANYRVEDLFGIVSSQWHLVCRRSENQTTLRVYNPTKDKDGWQSTHTVVEVVTGDMPFLVDSMSMELTRLGLTIHQMIYLGGIKCIRQQGQVVELIAHGDEHPEASAEAPIHMEIDRQSGEQALKDIEENLKRVLNDVNRVVTDWPEIQKQVRLIIEEYNDPALQKRFPDMKESREFLDWMLSDCFTFLGFREYQLVGEGSEQALQIVRGTGLGVLYDDTRGKQVRQYADLPEEARRAALSRDHCLTITKTNTRSTVHRPAYTDYVGVKKFDKNGKLVGERRIIGLYTSIAYSSNPNNIPFLREKVAQIMQMSGLPAKSHAGKDLLHILSTFPRDDLLHASADQIFELATGIMRLQERRRIRMFARKDMYGRFVSVLVFVPRENFNTDLAEQMRIILAEETDALEVMMNTRFSESVLARIHFVIRVDSSKPRDYDFAAIEQRLVATGQSWQDGLLENLVTFYDEESANELLAVYRTAFPAGYREAFMPRNAVFDIRKIEKLRKAGSPLEMSLYRSPDCDENQVKLKLFHPRITIPLSDAVPVLENMGFRVLGEETFKVMTHDGACYWINDFTLSSTLSELCDINQFDELFYEALLRLWQRDVENDSFNKLVVASRLNWHEVSLLRAYAKYFRQIGFTLSQQYIEQALVQNGEISCLIVDLFKQRFVPDFTGDRQQECEQIERRITAALDEVSSLDEDRILRMYVSVIYATVRTNFFQRDKHGRRKIFVSLKMDPSKVPDMPLPLPAYEVFVYSPRFEGVHLRSSNVARGGIRWSDRKEDFRVEVLGLMKAQQVKNAVIVPSGAKGGFVTKRTTAHMDRESFIAEGVQCYQNYIRGLFDVTDNLINDKVVHPADSVYYDTDDVYLVVAADKGTATFSDIANEISLHRNFWLKDAFASGGSVGYDHKKMGITARGAWVSAQRHFLELGLNADTAEISVIGIGDLAGDVFGNGVLMSPHLKLVAAFNHLHIFIDPTPDPQKSYEERKRIFNLPRSSWDDYDRKIISSGGGVYKRSAKAIRLTPEIKQLLHLDKDVVVPNELIRAILMAKVDLIWNGGIGTFVKSSVEKNSDVGDRFNDGIRVDGNELRAKVVCEGGNLGATQLGRIEFDLSGGKVNTDFIDNSAGVDCSDHEVNIKILLNPLVASEQLTEEQRNELLIQMTQEVSTLVLTNNYRQNQAISLLSLMSPSDMGLYVHYMNFIESLGLINRDLEFLPDNKQMHDRKAEGLGLTRPELSVLFSYSKNILKSEILKSDLLDDSFLRQFVLYAFPQLLRDKYESEIHHHPLSHEIIATQLSNQVVSDMGITLVYQMHDETGASVANIIRAYACAKQIFRIAETHQLIEALDYQIETDVQYQMMLEGIALVRRSIRWLLRNRREGLSIEDTINHFTDRVSGLFNRLPKLLVGRDREAYEARKQQLMLANAPEQVAAKVASAVPMFHALNIVEAATASGCEIYRVAKTYFMLVDRLELLSIRDYINAYPVDSRWAVLARASFKSDLDWVQRELAVNVLRFETDARSIPGRIAAWMEDNDELVLRVRQVIADLRSADSPDFAILSVAVRELMELAQIGKHRKEMEVSDQAS